MGDGTLASFKTTSDAVYCVGELMKACADEKITLRIGLNQGEVTMENRDIFGDGVNVASRIESLADSGQILVSEPIHRNIKNKEGIDSAFLKEAELKNVDEPIKVYQLEINPTSIASSHSNLSKSHKKKMFLITAGLAVAILIIYSLANYMGIEMPNHSKQLEKSIAVLPFRNDSPNKENLYFCNGIMEGILDHLAKIPELTVISSTSVEQYRENPPSITEIAKELNVNYILEGSVLRIGDRAQITAQLIYAPDDKHLWSDKYDKNIINVETVFIVLSDVAQTIAGELKAKISPELQERIESIPTSDLTAYDYYLQGKEFYQSWWRTQHESDLSNADRLYKTALVQDTTFAPAYVGRADIYRARHFNTSFFDEDFLDSVRIYCDAAINLDPGLAEAYLNRGEYYKSINNIKKAEHDLQKAIDLKPNYDHAIGRLSVLYYENKGDYISPIKLLNNGMNITRIPYNRSQGYKHYANIYMSIGYWKKSLFYFQQEKELNPSANNLYWNYIVQEKFQTAMEIIENIPNKKINSKSHLSQLGFIYLMLGDYDQSVHYFEKWEDKIREEKKSHYSDITNWIRYGQALAGAGKTQEGTAMMKDQLHKNEKIIILGRGNYSPLYDNAGICSFLGDTDRAIEYLRKYNESSSWKSGTIYFIQVDPLFDSMRDNQGYQEIVKKVLANNTNIRAEIEELETSANL